MLVHPTPHCENPNHAPDKPVNKQAPKGILPTTFLGLIYSPSNPANFPCRLTGSIWL